MSRYNVKRDRHGTSGSRLVSDVVNSALDAHFWHTSTREAYATFEDAGRLITANIKSNDFRNWLVNKTYKTCGQAAIHGAVDSALNVLAGKAVYDGETLEVHIRVAFHEGALWIDLMNREYEYVRITPDGWEVLPSQALPRNLKFRRPRGALSLGRPTDDDLPPGEGLNRLRQVFNLESDDDWVLIVSWILGAFRPRTATASGGYPVLLFQGEQGSGKSFTCQLVRSMVDPNANPLRSPPRWERDLTIAALNSWVVCLENLSGLDSALSDALCRLATGAGFGSRELYTDDVEFVISACRPVMLNGIDDFAVKADLIDRSISVALPAIDDDTRRGEGRLMQDFLAARPAALADICTMLSSGLAHWDDPEPAKLPRMADFATWIDKCEHAAPWPKGTFHTAYTNNRRMTTGVGVLANSIAGPLIRIAERNGKWMGTATDLLKLLDQTATSIEKRGRGWPRSAHELSNLIRRIRASLEEAGARITFDRTGSQRTVYIKHVTPESDTAPQPDQPDQPDQPAPSAASSKASMWSTRR